MTYKVIERNGWSYVVSKTTPDCPVPSLSGPWRYRYEAQEYADELNARPLRKEETKP